MENDVITAGLISLEEKDLKVLEAGVCCFHYVHAISVRSVIYSSAAKRQQALIKKFSKEYIGEKGILLVCLELLNPENNNNKKTPMEILTRRQIIK